MSLHTIFEELLRLPEENSDERFLVRGCAAAFQGFPRHTKDMCLFLNPMNGNVNRMIGTLTRFGFPSRKLSRDKLQVEELS